MSDRLHWIKSSYSDDEGGDCVEVALTPTIRIRDSKNPPNDPQLHVTPATWTAFITAVQPEG